MQLDDESKSKALRLVRELRDPTLPDEGVADRLSRLESILRRPNMLDLLFFNDPELTDEEVVEKAAAYKPIEL
ncbi:MULTISPECIES: hypothetical protein [unclassified Micromonospora]|uniref:hypothetical protein n=1 Tax=unclassified Micromonospora TaxID=2617518 RepID=UPI00363D5000